MSLKKVQIKIKKNNHSVNVNWHYVANRWRYYCEISRTWLYQTTDDEFGTKMILYDVTTVPFRPQNIIVYCDANKYLISSKLKCFGCLCLSQRRPPVGGAVTELFEYGIFLSLKVNKENKMVWDVINYLKNYAFYI